MNTLRNLSRMFKTFNYFLLGIEETKTQEKQAHLPKTKKEEDHSVTKSSN